jgi:hypothetical protein
MTLSSASVLVTNDSKYIQETLDLYTNENHKVTILRPQDCGKIVVYMKEKYDDLGDNWLKSHPYIWITIHLQKQEYNDKRPVKLRYKRKGQILYPGLPCFKCLEMILIYSKCVVKKGGRHTKSYHYQCSRSANVI